MQSFECNHGNMRYVLMKISVLHYLLSENSYLLRNFGTPLYGWGLNSPGAGGDLVAMKGPEGFSFLSRVKRGR